MAKSKSIGQRGQLTPYIKALSEECFGYEITVAELRLLPYIQHCLMNDENIDPIRVNSKDREILMKWQKEGRLSSPSADLTITSDFYDVICRILKVAYCQHSIAYVEKL